MNELVQVFQTAGVEEAYVAPASRSNSRHCLDGRQPWDFRIARHPTVQHGETMKKAPCSGTSQHSMDNQTAYLFVFDGFADWEPASALAELR